MIDCLTKWGVSVKEGEHRKAYANTKEGRAEIARVLQGEELEEVMAVWGDAPTVDDAPEPWLETLEDREIAAKMERDRRLNDTDIVYCNASNWELMENKMEWQEYKQALRDVPEQEGFPDAIDWPEMPELQLRRVEDAEQ